MIDYLGMRLNYAMPGKVEIGMEDFVENEKGNQTKFV
jgi:hypothetical protein